VLLDCPPSLGVLAVNCLATAGGMIAVVQPGGFELHALAHLHLTVQVCLEVGRLYPILGTTAADARLLYATTAGAIQRLTASKALDDYAKVVEQLRPVLP